MINIERTKTKKNQKVYLFGRVSDIVELPAGDTLAVGFDARDEYGDNYGTLYMLCSGYLSENRLMYNFLEHTCWYQMDARNNVSLKELRSELLGEPACLYVKYSGHSPEIIDIFCVTALEDKGFSLDGLELCPKSKEKKKKKKKHKKLGNGLPIEIPVENDTCDFPE